MPKPRDTPEMLQTSTQYHMEARGAMVQRQQQNTEKPSSWTEVLAPSNSLEGCWLLLSVQTILFQLPAPLAFNVVTSTLCPLSWGRVWVGLSTISAVTTLQVCTSGLLRRNKRLGVGYLSFLWGACDKCWLALGSRTTAFNWSPLTRHHRWLHIKSWWAQLSVVVICVYRVHAWAIFRMTVISCWWPLGLWYCHQSTWTWRL